MKRCPTCGRREKRSSEANARYWAILHKMASTVGFPADTLHVYYKSRFLGCDDVKLPNGKVLTIPRSTADKDTAEFAEYVDQVEADANERGVFLDE